MKKRRVHKDRHGEVLAVGDSVYWRNHQIYHNVLDCRVVKLRASHVRMSIKHIGKGIAITQINVRGKDLAKIQPEYLI